MIHFEQWKKDTKIKEEKKYGRRSVLKTGCNN